MEVADRELEFHADRVAEVTEADYVAVTQDTFVGPAIEQFRDFEPAEEETTVYYLYRASRRVPRGLTPRVKPT